MRGKRIALLRGFAAALLSLTLSACVYSKVVAPMDTDVQQTTLGPKIGRASSQSLLWLVAWGDGGVSAAAKDGGLKRVDHLDVETMIIFFGLYAKVTTIAYGE